MCWFSLNWPIFHVHLRKTFWNFWNEIFYSTDDKQWTVSEHWRLVQYSSTLQHYSRTRNRTNLLDSECLQLSKWCPTSPIHAITVSMFLNSAQHNSTVDFHRTIWKEIRHNSAIIIHVDANMLLQLLLLITYLIYMKQVTAQDWLSTLCLNKNRLMSLLA